MKLIEKLGGMDKLRQIIDTFVDRTFSDLMIGFFFRKADRQRVKEKEFEFAARFLGADIPYTGRSIKEAHAAHRIMGGQFARRKKILEEVLREFNVPEDVILAWLEHTETLRSQVTAWKDSACNAPEKNKDN